ncbi:pre-60S ribosomal particles component [Coemansia erecta]|uniref:Pre-60S ribosomal particles component n=1 Tax=Coemansia asiatica TaxID=1052880 RepID=A0A9W7XDZ1_9FUNG|nr:pre-60S ribosomal particles component [Coemansia asiatica]KAJ2856714.1 pre-60S ribosomal particles component [Coemansia erecta]KAJ2883502.1 pre-60S ribosomal particles component [Coemansia asiatica]
MSTADKTQKPKGGKGKITAKISKKRDIEEKADVSSDSENESSDASDNSSSAEESDYDEMAQARKKAAKLASSKKRKTADAEEFSNILSSILDQDARNESAPIMAKDKTRENQIKEEQLEYRARKALTAERKALKDKDRIVPTMENFDYERKLRKIATKGVIKLFNVVKAQQTELAQIEEQKTIQTEKVAEMSKSKFLDLLKSKAD